MLRVKVNVLIQKKKNSSYTTEINLYLCTQSKKQKKSKLFKKILLVTNNQIKIPNVDVIRGGKERSDSSFKGLKYLLNKKIKNVFIHDAARPNFSINLLKKLKKNLKNNKAVVPYINTNNSTKYKYKNKIINLKRERVYLTQTPQCFDFKTLYNLAKNSKNSVTDESSLFLKNNKKIKFIKGEEENIKITKKIDLYKNEIKTFYGIGFDIHKLVKNKNLYLAGVKIPFHSGLEGHSDGDVILHCIIDALLGALRKKDIGSLYPSNKSKFKNIRSPKMLRPLINNLKNNNYYINNLDINLICERPKVSKYRDKIINSLSKLMNINKNIINLKGKTVEKLGLIGKENAIACEAIISISKYE
ncbi:2-C-methyl-D-erythritol 2,4-cyclodiphosphate synthase [Candidatus Pelagibacter sp.]|nr:2-C-methyl-D-erythritol 2,4-cyclodiphosphate synthase [Candidatus Pelagibacter sp.]